MQAAEWILAGAYVMAGTVLLLYGLNCYWQIVFYLRGRRRLDGEMARANLLAEKLWRAPESLPVVTTQIPLYNEFNVAERILRSVARIDYPRDRHQIQVLDDSTDETRFLVDRIAAALKEEGHWIEVVRREDREAFKAGALKAGLEGARGEFVAVFDGDFVPEPDFLRKTLPPLHADPGLALVQGRWGHLNPTENLLCRAQSIGIDGHFGIEQAARSSNDLFLNFNGTAGLWRKEAIFSSGNWEGDTLTEDMDLSYRAQLAGWRLAFRPDAVVPAELPASFSAFKNQQFRWAKGSIQTARKLAPRIWNSDRRLVARIQAFLHLTHYAIHPFIVSVAAFSLPVLFVLPERIDAFTRVFGTLAILVGALGPNTLYLASQRVLHPRGWAKRVLLLPALTMIGLGISVSNSRGVIEGLLGVRSEFVRTPKKGARNARRYRAKASWVVGVEIALGAYCLVALVLYLLHGVWGMSPFLLLYALGYSFVGLRSLGEILDLGPRRAGPTRTETAETPDPGGIPGSAPAGSVR